MKVDGYSFAMRKTAGIQPEMEKRAFIPGALTVGGHITQNQIFKQLVKSPRYHKKLWARMAGNATEEGAQKAGTLKGEGLLGAVSGVFPEVNMIHGGLDDASRAFWKRMAEEGVKVEDLTKRDLVGIKTLLKGDFRQAARLKYPNKKTVEKAFVDSVPQGRNMSAVAKSVDGSRTDEVLDDLGGVYKENWLTGNLGKGLAKAMHTPPATASSRSAATKVNKASDLGVAAAVVGIDTPTAAVNAVKKGLGSKKLGRVSKPVGKIQGKMQDTFLKKPVNNKFLRGIDGKGIKLRKARQIADESFLNSATSAAKNLAYDVGRVGKKHGVTRERIEAAKKISKDPKQSGAELLKKHAPVTG